MNAIATPLTHALRSSLQSRDAADKSVREAAFAEFLRIGLPTQKLDAWKYTDLRRLAAREFQFAKLPAATVDATALLPITCTHRIVFVDGIFDAARSSLPNTAGLTSRIDTAMHREVGATLHARARSSAFELLNTALRTANIDIEAAANISLPQPIYIVFVWSRDASQLMQHPRITLRVSNGARLQLLEHHIGLNNAPNFTNVSIDIALESNVEMLHTRIQEDAAANFLIDNLDVDIASNARYINHQYILGAGLSRCDLQLQLSGANAHAELHGLLLAHGNQHVDVRTCIDHCVPNTRSIEDYRGIANDRGRVIFNGKVIVRPNAQKTDARQSSRNLLLSPTAEIDTRPELEIYANDVQCAHGATVGQLDATALFYLRSRGLGVDAARALLTHAFAAELLERLPDASLREYVLVKLMQKLGSREQTL